MADSSIDRRESSTVSQDGRVVIPASIRRALGLEAGSRLTFRLEGGYVLMSTQDMAITKLRQMFRDAPNRADRSLVDELIAERQSESRRENLE